MPYLGLYGLLGAFESLSFGGRRIIKFLLAFLLIHKGFTMGNKGRLPSASSSSAFFTLSFLAFASLASASPFIATFNTMITSGSVTPANQLKLPLSGTYTVNWGDGSGNILYTSTANPVHGYATNGLYTVTITNNGITGFAYNNGNDKNKLITITQWGNVIVGGAGIFEDCYNVNSIATDSPVLTGSLSQMFAGDTSFNSNIANWNTNSVTDMSSMFNGDSVFNQPIGAWNTMSVQSMSEMFYGDPVFNANIAAWNTNSVTDMSSMFYQDPAFNQPIGAWNTMSVQSMQAMFYQDSAFNANIAAWNTNSVTDMSIMFYGDPVFNSNIANWNTNSVTDMSGMFALSAFNQPIGAWNTVKVTTMAVMFDGDSAFNQPIGSWNTNSVMTMANMFNGASAFNGNIANWNTISVTTITGMFQTATAFNQNIGSWNTNSVTNMASTFSGASAFNQPIGSWNTMSVTGTGMESMFYGDSAFNQPIGAWNTNSVTNLRFMFLDDYAFNQNIGAWNTVKVTNMGSMFTGVTLSISNYDALLNGWASESQSHAVSFGGGSSQYDAIGVPGYNTLHNTYGWTFSDGGYTYVISQPIISQPVIYVGQTETISATITGGTPNYSGNAFITNPASSPTQILAVASQSSNSLSKSWTVTANELGTGNTGNFVITDSYPLLVSSPSATFSVYNPLSSLTLTPSSLQTIDAGQTVSFASSAAGGAPTMTYQWYSGTSPAGCTGLANPIAGAASSSYTTPVTGAGTVYYCLEDTDGKGSTIISTPTEVVTYPALSSLTLTPSSLQTINVWQTVSFTSSVAGGAPTITYQWYSGTSPAGCTGLANPIAGAASSSYTTPAGVSGTITYYCLEDTDGTSSTIISAPAEVVVNRSIQGSGGGASVGAPESSTLPTAAPYLSGNRTGYTISNFSQSNSETVSINGTAFTVVEESVTTASAVVTINGKAYNLTLNIPVALADPVNLTYYAELTGIGSPPTNALTLLLYAQPNQAAAATTTVAPSNATTTVPPSTTTSIAPVTTTAPPVTTTQPGPQAAQPSPATVAIAAVIAAAAICATYLLLRKRKGVR